MTLSEVEGGGGGGGGGGTGTQHYYPIPDADVGGTGDAITLTTGESLAGYTNGLLVYFNSTDANTGAVTLAVDGLAAIPLRGSNGRGSATDLPARAITGSDPVLAVYDSAFNEFNFIPGHQGTAAQRNIGIFEFDVPELGTGGLLDTGRFAPGGAVGQALLRTATGQEWGDVAGSGMAGISGETEFLFAGVWFDSQIRETNIQVPADARYIAAVFQMAGSHSSVSDDPYTSVQVFDADRFRSFTAIAVGDNPRDNNGNFFGVDIAGAPNDLLVAKVTSGGNEVIGVAATTQIQARARNIRVRFITDIAGAGAGDITAVTTASGSGLSGGVDTGAADLVLDIAGLTNQPSTGLNDSDILFLGDVSDSADPRKHLTIGGLMSFATSGESTTDSGGGKIRVANRGIDVQQMSITGTPAAGQVISYDGAGMEWATPTGGGTAYTDADVDARVLDRLQNAANSGASFSDRLLVYDDGNPTELRSSNMGALRGYMVSTWAQPTNSDVIAIAKIASGGAADQVLTWTATGQEWAAAAGGGIGTITAVGTAANSGLAGGTTSGAANLVLDITALPDLSSAEVVDTDALFVWSSMVSARRRRISFGSLMDFAADDVSIEATAGQLGVKDSGIRATMLDTNNVPASGQVLSYDGINDFTWIVPGSGAGDITDVTAGLGISGGGSTGSVSVALTFNNLPLESPVAATDRFAFQDVSDGNAMKYVTWGGAIASAADQDTIITANARMRINDGGVDTNELADEAVTEPKILTINTPTAGQVLAFAAGNQFAWSDAGTGDITAVTATGGLSGGGTTGAVSFGIADEGVTEARMDISNAPTSGYVLGWNGTEMEWRAEGTTPTPTHTSYTATSADQTFIEAEFLAGNSGVGNALEVTIWTGSLYAAFARPVSAGTITELYFYAQGAGRGNNQIGGWTTQATVLSISGEDHYVIQSNNILTAIPGIQIVIEVV